MTTSAIPASTTHEEVQLDALQKLQEQVRAAYQPVAAMRNIRIRTINQKNSIGYYATCQIPVVFSASSVTSQE